MCPFSFVQSRTVEREYRPHFPALSSTISIVQVGPHHQHQEHQHEECHSDPTHCLTHKPCLPCPLQITGISASCAPSGVTKVTVSAPYMPAWIDVLRGCLFACMHRMGGRLFSSASADPVPSCTKCHLVHCLGSITCLYRHVMGLYGDAGER